MRTIAYALLLLSVQIGCSPHAGRPAPAPGDSLVTERPRLSDARADLYMATVGMVFADESGAIGTGCLQVLLLHETGPEELIFLDCLGQIEGHPARVVRLVADRSISDVLDQSGFDAAKSIAVRKSEAEISAEDSQQLQAVWLGMLQRARARSEQPAALPRYQFSACVPLKGCLAGVTARPRRGSGPAVMADLSELLATFTSASATDRVGIIEDIRRKTKALRLQIEESPLPSAP